MGEAELPGADDPASVLALILVEKGTITSTDLARVDAAAVPDKAAVLASKLLSPEHHS